MVTMTTSTETSTTFSFYLNSSIRFVHERIFFTTYTNLHQLREREKTRTKMIQNFVVQLFGLTLSMTLPLLVWMEIHCV